MIAALAALNLLTWFVYRFDKARARIDGQRVPEKRLLALAAYGGWPAAKLAQHHFRHKTRKQPFARRLNLIVLGWLTGLWVLISLGLLGAP
ncbi:MAG: DUF1294 domain-containing protein [Roseovarius sp.]